MPNGSISIFILAIPVIAVVGVLISYILYRNRLRKAIENEQKRDYTSEEYEKRSQAHTFIPTPAATSSFMNKLFVIALLIYICLSTTKLLITTSQLKQMSEDLESLKVQISQNYDNLYRCISNTTSTIEEVIREQNSLISSLDTIIQDADLENNTCDLMFSLALKNKLSDAAIQLTLYDDTVIDLVKDSSGYYTGKIQLPLYNHTLEDNYVTISIKSEEADATEFRYLDIDFDRLWIYYIPSIDSTINFYNFTEDAIDLADSCLAFFNVSSVSDKLADNIKTADFILINEEGEEIHRQDYAKNFKDAVANNQEEKIMLSDLHFAKSEVGNFIVSKLVFTLNNNYSIEYILDYANFAEQEGIATQIEHTISIYNPNGKVVASSY